MRVEVHHIDGDRENNHHGNLKPLCSWCHGKVHGGDSNSDLLEKRLADPDSFCSVCRSFYADGDYTTHLAKEHPDVIRWEWSKDDRGLTESELESFIEQKREGDDGRISPRPQPAFDFQTTDTGDGQSTTDPGLTGESNGPEVDREDLPYIIRRDSITDGREQVNVALRPEVKDQEPEHLREVCDELGISTSDVSLYDLREAMYRVALEHPDAVAEKLVEDGYNLV